MNQQINVSEVQPAALEIKGAKTMNKVIRNSLTITAFAALALVFGACSQPEVTSSTDAIVPNISAATDVISDATADTPATAEDLAELKAPDSSEPGLQAQGADKVAPVLFNFYPSSGSTTYYNYASPYLEFSEKMKHDSVKKAFTVVVTPASGASYNAKGTFYWVLYGTHEYFWFYPNKVYPSGSLVSWKINRDAKDLAGNKLFAGKNATFRVN
jgi:hypothetical protein